jgi:1-acyl-sn-glycerol-3-phosphate acyltransferase
LIFNLKNYLLFEAKVYSFTMHSRLYAVLSILVFGILFVYTALGVFIVLIFSLFHLKGTIQFLLQVWAKSVFLIMGKRFKVHGNENIKKDERYILVANHSSLFDIVAIVSFYRGISWFGHERLLKIPVFNRILKMTDYVAFKEPTIRNTKQMLELLVEKSRTKTIAIFPEGTRTLNGKINYFYKGFIYLFRNTDLEILPVTLNGFYKLKPKNRFYINFKSELDVVIHKAIKREELINKTDNEIIESIKAVIESAYT